MQLRKTGLDLVVGSIAGLIATKVTDRVQAALWDLTPKQLREQEPTIPEGSSAKRAARLLLEKTGCDTSEPRLAVGRAAVHYGLGIAWGALYMLLRRGSGMTPAGAGVASGVALSLVVDEALCSQLKITPPSSAYPWSAHTRGLLTHIAWGLAAAATAESLLRCRPRRRQT